jgi:hypothetical protein
MAIIQVNLTSESLHHLQMILEAAIDTTASPVISIKPAFQPLVRALHQMVVIASLTPHGSPIPEPRVDAGTAGELRITLPRALDATEERMVHHLDHMVDSCIDSIRNENAISKIVLEV